MKWLKNSSKYAKKATCFLLTLLIIALNIPMSVLALENPKFYSSRTETSEEALFECNSVAGWVGYRTADHWTYDDNNNEVVAYCLQHKYLPPTGSEEFRIVNGSDYYDAETLTGLNIIASYGYPNETGGFTEHEARYATCSAIRWWIAEQEDAGKFNDPDAHYNYDNLKNGNVRPKSGYENLFNWAKSLVEKARTQVEMQHTVNLSPSALELTDDGKGNYTGSITVSLTNCNGGYKVPDSVIKTIQDMNGTITGVTGNSGEKITVSIPKEGNANKDIRLSVIGLDSRIPGNFIFSEPDRNKYPQTGGSGDSMQRMFAIFETRDNAADASALLSTPKNSIASIIKIDSETHSASQGDAVLTGALFKIVAAEDIAGTAIKSGDTVIENLSSGKTVELFPGKYFIYETKAPEGYILTSQPKQITIPEADKEYTFEFENTVIKRKIAIVKFLGENIENASDNNVPQIPEANAEFQVILKSTNMVVDTIITDEQGYGVSKDLPYGTYTVHQTKGKEGYTFMDDVDIVINENLPEKPYLIIADNFAERMLLRIIKTDAETGKTVAVAGATFRIKDANGNYVSQTIRYPQTQTISEWVTDESGTVQLPNTLPYGKYTITEITAPQGYAINNNEISFTISKSNASTQDPLYVEVKVSDMPIKGQIQIEKTGPQFVGTEDVIINGYTVTKPIFEEKNLSGAEFKIIAKEDIIINGELKAAAGETVDTVITSKNGAKTKELYLGTYLIVETKAPNGYIINNEPIEVTLQSKGQEFPVVEVTKSIENEYQGAEIYLTKEAEILEYKITETTIKTVPGEGFIFGLYTAEDIILGNAEIHENALVDIGTTNAEGKLVFSGTYPHGHYYIQEIYTNTDYKENTTKYPIELLYNSKVEKIKIEINKPIVNEIETTLVKLSKYDITGQTPIPSAIIEVFNEDGILIYREKTDECGKTPDLIVQKGQKYTFKEIYAPEGYALNVSTMAFEVTEDGEIIGETSIKDEINYYEILKTDETGKPLKGCEFGLFDENNNLIMTAISDENGIARFEKMPYGKLTIKEIKATEGYQISDRIITIEVTGTWINKTIPDKFENIPVITTDAANVTIWLIPISLIAFSFGLYVYRKIKNNKRKE